MGGVWRWIFVSQLAFTFKTVLKALDRDVHFVYGATRPLSVSDVVVFLPTSTHAITI